MSFVKRIRDIKSYGELQAYITANDGSVKGWYSIQVQEITDKGESEWDEIEIGKYALAVNVEAPGPFVEFRGIDQNGYAVRHAVSEEDVLRGAVGVISRREIT